MNLAVVKQLTGPATAQWDKLYTYHWLSSKLHACACITTTCINKHQLHDMRYVDLVWLHYSTWRVGHIAQFCCPFSYWRGNVVGQATIQHNNNKSGYSQGKPPHRLQNTIKTQIMFYPNAINTLHAFYPTVQKTYLTYFLPSCSFFYFLLLQTKSLQGRP